VSPLTAPMPKNSMPLPIPLPNPDPHRPPRAAAKRILIIEDDKDIIQGMNLRLRSRGYETLEAYDGEAGVSGAVENHPDAIVMDVRMPRMDGLQALSRLQSLAATNTIPVIMLAASLADRQAAIDAGARCFLKKPYQSENLIAALENALDQMDCGKTRIAAHA
jgi:CheY-like chemotaxis protein